MTNDRSVEALIDAIRLTLLQVENEKRPPFVVEAPNAITLQAMKELEAGKGKRFANGDELFEDIGA